MNADILQPIPSHVILVLLLQLAGLLTLARLLTEFMRWIGQPAVIGELLAGLILGPTILGHFAPELFAIAFPQETLQFHLLEVVSWLGMILLLLLTGLETDLQIVRTLGRGALLASLCGLVIPFASGFGLGWFVPERFLADPTDRGIFAAFLATAMAISAMPVIAKILIDLDLMKRNIGVMTLSAGVVDDTIGWLILSVIAGLATAGHFSVGRLMFIIVGLGLYLAGMRWLVFPVFSRLLRWIYERVEVADADVTLILGFTFISAAATEAIGVHAVFGAFVMGLLIRQVPRVRMASLSTLETFVLSLLSPIFFTYVGLRVDLWALTGWGFPAIALLVATTGKIAGCYLGGRLGRLSRWESLALGFGMNARGAMGLIVALIGLSLGLITQEVYATIVMISVVTSFMSPILLRLVVPRLPMGADERRRLESDARQRLLPSGPLRILVPTAGGADALAAFALAAPIVRHRQGSMTALYVERASAQNLWSRFRRRRGSDLAGRGLDLQIEEAAARLGDAPKGLITRRVTHPDPLRAIREEASRDFDLMMIGAGPHHLTGDSFIGGLLRDVRMPVIVVRNAIEPPAVFTRVVVPVDGSLFSRYAVEFAFAYAAAARAHVTLLHVINETKFAGGGLPVPVRSERRGVFGALRENMEAGLRADFGLLASEHGISWTSRIVASGDPSGTIIEESRSQFYDLLVLGAENKLLGVPLFLGQGTAAIVENAGCTTAVFVPYVA